MKNTPNKIFLNIGTDEKDLDFNTLSEVTWSKDRVFDSDLEFISVSFLSAEIDKEIKELKKSRKMALSTRELFLKQMKKELKNLLKWQTKY